MLFKFNEFIMAISFALDFVEMDILGVTSNHGKRVAFISLCIAEKLGFNQAELHDMGTLALLHDNGASERGIHEVIKAEESISINSLERAWEHCAIGEVNIAHYPFLMVQVFSVKRERKSLLCHKLYILQTSLRLVLI